MEMRKMKKLVGLFWKGIVDNKIAFCGTVITLILFPILILYAVLDGMHLIENPVLDFIVYGGLTWVFALGHLMVFSGLFILKNDKIATLFTSDEFKIQPSKSGRFRGANTFVLFIVFITLFNIVVISVSSYNGFHYSESVDFCARLCHSVMTPEFTAYQNSPHSRVECVECHIGSGASWFARSKLSGMKQLIAVVRDTYSKPIETPIHGLRPASDTCEECHRPELFHGDRLRIKDRFMEDEANTRTQTVMLMKVGSGDYRGLKAQGSHWHVASSSVITYVHSDAGYNAITEVRVSDSKGVKEIFEAKQAEHSGTTLAVRTFDCLDCHNRPTHIYLWPDEALDQKLAAGTIPVDLPYVKKKGMELITPDYASRDEAVEIIAREMHTWYRSQYAGLVEDDPIMLERAIAGVTEAYLENVFPDMNIGYGTYENRLGHRSDNGSAICVTLFSLRTNPSAPLPASLNNRLERSLPKNPSGTVPANPTGVLFFWHARHTGCDSRHLPRSFRYFRAASSATTPT
jgi:hypothetical protein